MLILHHVTTWRFADLGQNLNSRPFSGVVGRIVDNTIRMSKRLRAKVRVFIVITHAYKAHVRYTYKSRFASLNVILLCACTYSNPSKLQDTSGGHFMSGYKRFRLTGVKITWVWFPGGQNLSGLSRIRLNGVRDNEGLLYMATRFVSTTYHILCCLLWILVLRDATSSSLPY